MSSVNISNVNPIDLVAVVTPVIGAGYTVTVVYGTTSNVEQITDDFDSMPSTVTVNVTSSTVPAGYHLAATGDGSWTTVDSSTLIGSFAGSGTAASVEYSFTILVTDGSTVIARHDPRLILRKVSGF